MTYYDDHPPRYIMTWSEWCEYTHSLLMVEWKIGTPLVGDFERLITEIERNINE